MEYIVSIKKLDMSINILKNRLTNDYKIINPNSLFEYCNNCENCSNIKYENINFNLEDNYKFINEIINKCIRCNLMKKMIDIKLILKKKILYL